MASIGLVLSGGMAKGAYQLGALKAIAEHFAPEEFSVISCSSIGCLNGYAFAMQRLSEAEQKWRQLCEFNTSQNFIRVLHSDFLHQEIDQICSANESLPTKCYLTLLDASNRRTTYFNLQNAPKHLHAQYLRASVAFPCVAGAVRIGNASYFDGALVDNIPFHPLLLQPPDYIFCIYFDNYSYTFESTLFDQRIVKITLPPKNRLKDSIMFRRETIGQMLEQGYEDSTVLLHGLLAHGKDDLDYIYRCIQSANRRMPAPKLRVTADMIGTNLNRVLKKVTKKKIE